MKTVVISGGGRGIGLELCREYQKAGDNVIALCRNSSAELEALGVRVLTGLDFHRPETIEVVAGELGDVTIDRLINNAGLLHRHQLGQIGAARVNEILDMYMVNSVGPLLLTEVLADRLNDGARVAIISSRMGSCGDNSSGGHYGYRMSKAAANIVGVSLARDLAERGVLVAILHPGYVRTDMTANKGEVRPGDAAAGLIRQLETMQQGDSGRFRHASGEVLPF